MFGHSGWCVVWIEGCYGRDGELEFQVVGWKRPLVLRGMIKVMVLDCTEELY